MLICNDELNIILIAKTILKAQNLPLVPAQLRIPGFTVSLNFVPSSTNLVCSSIRGMCIYAADHLRVSEVSLDPYSSVEHVLVSLSPGSNHLLFGCIYWSPSSTGEEHAALWSTSSNRLIHHVTPMWCWWVTSTSHRLTGKQNHLAHLLPTYLMHFWMLYMNVSFSNMFTILPAIGGRKLQISLTWCWLMRRAWYIILSKYIPGLARSYHLVLKFMLVCYTKVKTYPQITQTKYDQLTGVLKSLSWEAIGSMNLKEAYETFKWNISNAVEKCSKRTPKQKHLHEPGSSHDGSHHVGYLLLLVWCSIFVQSWD